MHTSQVARKCISTLEQEQWETALATLSDDFNLQRESFPATWKKGWLEINQSLAKAMPDRSYGFPISRKRSSTP